MTKVDVCKICRREGVKLFLKGERCFSVKCSLTRRSYAPGARGQRKGKKLSDYGILLREKQKVKKSYGLTEATLRRYMRQASKSPQATNEILYQMLETRLDNIVYRLGFAPSRLAARQLVRHGKVKINDKKINFPSYPVKKDQIISLKLKPDKIPDTNIASWLSFNKKEIVGKLIEKPSLEKKPSEFDFDLITEFYAR